MAGKTVLITGANRGIGRAAAVDLARRGARLILAGRSEVRHADVANEVQSHGGAATFVELDLADLDSVRRAVSEVRSLGVGLDVLVCNAAVGADKGTTKDGFELAFGVNHLGHFLLTESLLPLLEIAAPSRVVLLSSGAHHWARRVDWEALRAPSRSFMALHEYGVSKLCNLAYARELAERTRSRGIHSYAAHPGPVATELILSKVPWGFRGLTRMALLTAEQGARTPLHCATSAEAGNETGLYYHRARPRRPSRLARDPEFARTLVRRSAEWVGLDVGALPVP
jgi:NAD(P)-dependent dehydrogenase (short-subunit alcohol dehydrogenase family)